MMALWDKISSRGHVEDRRGVGPFGIGGGGIGLLAVGVFMLINLFSGGSIDPNSLDQILGQLQQTNVGQQAQPEQFAGEDEYEEFASTVIGSTNDLWRRVFEQNNKVYQEPRLVLFRGATNSGCGFASAQTGPHYCPVDQTIYLDETFFDQLQKLGGNSGDVAQAYVLAHEAGHHVQNQLGIMREVQSAGNNNDLSIKLELQADCFAGLWAYSIKDLGVFGENEISEAISAAEAVGDDRIQEKSTGQVNPETWTHGSSTQRVEWFNKGYATGQVDACDTFSER